MYIHAYTHIYTHMHMYTYTCITYACILSGQDEPIGGTRVTKAGGNVCVMRQDSGRARVEDPHAMQCVYYCASVLLYSVPKSRLADSQV